MALAGNIALGATLVIGVVLMIVGGVLISVFRKEIHKQVVERLPLSNGSDSFNTWKDPPAPVYMQFYVFDVRNAYEVVQRGDKPIVYQRGPYTYRELQPKEDTTFLSNGTKLFYNQPKTFIFEPNMSVGSDEEKFTTVNLPMLTIATKLKTAPSWAQKLVNKLIRAAKEGLFGEFTVRDYLWGYPDPLLAEINNLTSKIGIHVPDTFGLFYGATGNGSAYGNYTIYTGTGNIDDINTIEEWNGASNVTYWRNQYCNMINGSDGTQWHPYVDKTERLYLFSSDICRSIYIDYDSDYTHRGISLTRFTPPASVFASAKQNPDNQGFCNPNCLGSGVLDVSSCRGAPIIMSLPHFYQGDEKYVEAITGMDPHKEEHQTHIDIEHYTGAAMVVAKRLQINAGIHKLAALQDTNLFNFTIFPLVWLNESATINEKGVNDFHSQVLKPIWITHIVELGLLIVGAIIVLLAVILIARKIMKHSKNKDDTPLLTPDDPTVTGSPSA